MVSAHTRRQGAPPARPFLRWAGGKQQLSQILLRCVPPDHSNRLYREPFLGAGTLFFALEPRRACLADSNEHLIRCYEFVRDGADLVAEHLKHHARQTCEEYYYRVRRDYNRLHYSAAQAARFIYLNKACFNGVFRVNLRGEFNVPYGHKDPPALPDQATLRRASLSLRRAQIECSDFEESLSKAGPGEFVYLDPPYPPLNSTSYFAHYTASRFSMRDQERLARVASLLDRLGCKILVSNADVPPVRALYRGFNLVPLTVRRYITCKAHKHLVHELIITNYEVPPWPEHSTYSG